MRALSAVAPWLLFLAGCGSSGGTDAGNADAPLPPVHATLAWQVRCDDMGGCTTPPARTLDADHGASGAVVRCDVSSFDGTSRALSFEARDPGGWGVAIEGALFPLAGGRVTGDACLVTVREPADGTVVGACGANLPSTDAPCQIQRLTLDTGVLAFELRCEGAPIEGSAVVREVVPATSTTGHVEVTVTGCSGL